MSIQKIKELGQVFTPKEVVKFMLDKADYIENLRTSRILEPACGDGAFLVEILQRLINDCRRNLIEDRKIITIIQNTIYGYEIDKKVFNKCIKNLNKVLEDNNLPLQVDWKRNILNTSFLNHNIRDKYDFIIGNPPYVSIQNIPKEDNVYYRENFEFSKGNYDLYSLFFEQALNQIKQRGTICFITPNSYFTGASFKKLREELVWNNRLNKIFNYKDHLVFEGVQTYAAITLISKSYLPIRGFDYYEYSEDKKDFVFVDEIKFDKLNSDCWDLGGVLKSNKERRNRHPISRDFNVVNGLATLADKVFISDNGFKGYDIETELIYDIVKGSSLNGNNINYKKCLNIYNLVDNLVRSYDEEEFKTKFPNAYKYLLDNKETLSKRAISKGVQWFEYGRKQSLNFQTQQEKIVLNPIFKDKIYFKRVPKNVMVYSGFIITPKTEEADFDKLEKFLSSEEFLEKIKNFSKHLSGGYYQMSSARLKCFQY